MASWFNLTWRLLALRMLTAVVVYSLAAPLALYFLLALLFRLLRSPLSGFWRLVPRESPPAVLQDPKLGEHAFVTLDKGIKLHYVHAGDPSRPLLLFLHGFPGFWFSWKHQLPEFAKDYWVVALDMRGYGDSDKPSGNSSYRADILVDDIKELLEAFERPRATLVGHGWGAAVAWMFLERYPERVDKLVSIGAPHPYVFQRAVILNRKQLSRSWYLFLFQVPLLPEVVLRCDDLACLVAALKKHTTLPDEDVEAFKYTFGKPGALTPPLNYYRAAGWGLPRRRRRPGLSPASTTTTNTTSPNSPEELSASLTESCASTILHQDPEQDDEEEQQQEEANKCADSTTASSPAVLVLLGGRDAYVEHSTAFRTRKSFPNVSVVIVRGANHFVQLHDPEAVNIAVRKFLEK